MINQKKKKSNKIIDFGKEFISSFKAELLNQLTLQQMDDQIRMSNEQMRRMTQHAIDQQDQLIRQQNQQQIQMMQFMGMM